MSDCLFFTKGSAKGCNLKRSILVGITAVRREGSSSVVPNSACLVGHSHHRSARERGIPSWQGVASALEDPPRKPRSHRQPSRGKTEEDSLPPPVSHHAVPTTASAQSQPSSSGAPSIPPAALARSRKTLARCGRGRPRCQMGSRLCETRSPLLHLHL